MEMRHAALPPVVSIVGKSGVGKTTFIEKLLVALKTRGLRVGVIKHHGHPTLFDMPGKDTYRHFLAGADVVIGASSVQVAVFARASGEVDLGQLIAQHGAGLDLMLTEGYKRGPFPKIEIHRAAHAPDLLCQADELLALVSDEPLPLAAPQFGLEDAEGVANLLLAWLGRQQGQP